MFKLLANMAGLVMVIAGTQILIVNRRFLPKAVRASGWREAGLVLCVVFYAVFSFFVVRDAIGSLF
ncbi:MAG: hypothetical protein IT184_16180 [Acidobacteria bacterium]|nr:hypothetical protein [Acidobacteriota bacterium]